MLQYLTDAATLLTLFMVHYLWIGAAIGSMIWWAITLRGGAADSDSTSAHASAASRYRIALVGLMFLLVAIPLAIGLAFATRPSKQVSVLQSIVSAPSSDIALKVGVGLSNSQYDSAVSLEHGLTAAEGLLDGNVTNSDPTLLEHSLGENSRVVSQTSYACQSLVNAITPWIAGAYLFGLAVMLLRLSWMLLGCQRIMHSAKPLLDPHLEGNVRQRASELGLSRIPKIATSLRVATPMIAGLFKPVLLLPASMVTGLTASEIDIIICHELAHLRRFDPWVVMLQRTLESLLFFHPVTWYVSRCLDREREFCCDELVLSLGPTAVDYAKTLFRVAEFGVNPAANQGFSLAVTGESPVELVQRVRVILGSSHRVATRHNLPARMPIGLTVLSIFGGIAIAAICIVLAASSTWASGKNGSRDVSTSEVSGLPETTPSAVAPVKAGQANRVQQDHGWPTVQFNVQVEHELLGDPIRLRAIDSEGNVVSSAELQLTLGNGSGSTAWMRPKSMSDQAVASFEQRKSQLTFYNLVVITATEPTGQLAAVLTYDGDAINELLKSETLDVVLKPCITITGTVTDIDTGQPLADSTVELSCKLHPKLVTLSKLAQPATTDQAGRFTMLGVVPEMLGFLTAKHPDCVAIKVFDKTIAPTKANCDFDLQLVSKKISPETKIPQVSAPDVSELSAVEAIAKLKSDFVSASSAFNARYRETKTAAESTFVAQRFAPYQTFLDAMLNVADAHRGTELEAEALAWCCKMNRHSSELNPSKRIELRKQIADRLIADHLASLEIEDCLADLAYSQPDPLAILEKVGETNPKKEIQGKAFLLAAESIIRKLDSDMRMASTGRPGASAERRQEWTEQALRILRRVKSEYGDVPYRRNDNLGITATKHIRSLTQITVGQPAPEITGINQFGEPMKLSDFRGKVVVLDFWGSWCGPCIQDLPQLNDLAKLYPDDVAVIGIVNDTRDLALQALLENEINWPNWIGQQQANTIENAWNINSWPSTYIVDRDGIIRSTGFGKVVGVENFRKQVEKVLEKIPSNEGSKTDADRLSGSQAGDNLAGASAGQAEELQDFSFDADKFRGDDEAGFKAVLPILLRAEKANAPPLTVAKLRCDTAKFSRMIALNARQEADKDFTRSITILRGVVTKPDKFLVDKPTAQQFVNCFKLLLAIMRDQTKQGDISNAAYQLESAAMAADVGAAIEAAPALNDRDRLYLSSSIRLTMSNESIDSKNWQAAIDHVSPVIEQADRFLEDTEGARRIGMATRQQSMFLAYDGQVKESAQLIDEMCEKFENAEQLDEAVRLSMLCMLRGKHMINFDRQKHPQLFEAGWSRYQEIAKRVRQYSGPERAAVIVSALDMHRLVSSPADNDQAIEIFREMLRLVESEPELHEDESRAKWHLHHALRRIKGPDKAALTKEVKDFYEGLKETSK